ncbi:MAG: flagellin [Janthinobacterium lividum]
MALSILNNISALQAENQLNVTTASANKSLQQLSSGSRINSGSDDAAGLSISDGLNANVSALTQSSENATNAVGSLQTADGALAQVTTLLNRSITLATEASNTGLSTAQSTAINSEFQALMTQINNISVSTNFNGTPLFGSTISAFTSDGTSSGTVTIGTTVSSVDSTSLGLGSAALSTSDSAQSALTLISTAIAQVAQDRGTLGATVEQLQAASTVDTDQSQNLTSASSAITSADISSVVASDTKYSILEQTGISALQQANQQAENVLKLIQ